MFCLSISWMVMNGGTIFQNYSKFSPGWSTKSENCSTAEHLTQHPQRSIIHYIREDKNQHPNNFQGGAHEPPSSTIVRMLPWWWVMSRIFLRKMLVDPLNLNMFFTAAVSYAAQLQNWNAKGNNGKEKARMEKRRNEGKEDQKPFSACGFPLYFWKGTWITVKLYFKWMKSLKFSQKEHELKV